MAEAYAATPAKQKRAPDPGARVAAYIEEIRLALRDREAWTSQNRRIIQRYRQRVGSTGIDDDAARGRRRFSLFWSNIEVLKPAVFARIPRAVVKRRYDDNDPVGRMASQVLERAINFSLECRDSADIFLGVRDEFLLIGLGQVWARYVPKITVKDPAGNAEQAGEQVADGGAAYDVVEWEDVLLDHVTWEDFLWNVARKWSEVRWVARRVYMNRDELVARFPKCGPNVPLNHQDTDGQASAADRDDPTKKAEVWELWDLPSKTAVWINLDYPDECLDERPDPLGLKGFFPCPRPLLGTRGPDSLLPTPDYVFYRSQARDIDELTARIGKLTDALKMRGFYAAGSQAGKDLATVFDRDTNELIPVDGWAAFAEAGGVKGMIEWMPLDMVVSTITACITARKQLVDDVYQVTGIADIMRGDNDPRETATATRTKQTWGSSRVRSKQQEMVRFCRDVLELAGEIIASKFNADTLAEMTNVKMLPSPQAKQQLQAELSARAAAAAPPPPPQGQGGPPGAPPPQGPPARPPTIPFQPPPEIMELLGRPTWEEVMAVLQEKASRTFRIDIETDSTIEPDVSEKVEQRVQVTQVMGLYISKTIPLIQLYPATAPLVAATAKWLLQAMPSGREIEEAFDKALEQFQAAVAGAAGAGAGAQQGQQQAQQAIAQAQAAQAQAAQISAQAKATDAQTGQFDAQTKRMKAIADAQNSQAQIHAENARTLTQHAADAHSQGADIAATLHQEVIKSIGRQFGKEITPDEPAEGGG